MVISASAPRAAVLAAVIGLSAGRGAAQDAAHTAAGRGAQRAPLDGAVRRAVVDTVAAQFIRFYVDADTGRMIAERVRRRLRSGAYDRVSEPLRFAEILTADLRSVNRDGHLVVEYSPDEPGLRPGPGGIQMLGAPDQVPPPAVVAEERRRHFALGRVEILPGNVGYLEIGGFSGAPEAQDAVLDALRYLQYTDAIVFDLRRNGGGSAELVNFVISHFTGPDTIASLTVRNRSANESFTRYTLRSVPGPRRPTLPLYILTSRYTASAGEDFAFVLQNMKRAIIVGDRTAGAGHNNAFLDSGHGFNTSISLTRVTDPRTGREWERVGVQPDVPCDPDRALDVAHLRAMDTLISTISEEPRRRVMRLRRATIAARLHPHVVPARRLVRYPGEYEGGRSVRLAGGKLLYRPTPGVPADTLVSLSDSMFAIGTSGRIVFEGRARGVTALRALFSDGTSLVYRRVGSVSAPAGKRRR